VSWKKRAAFTLIEVLVVIAIIGILAALLLGGVMAVIGRGPEAQTRNEISQLAIALEKFKGDKGFYPPDRIKLHANYAQYNPGLNNAAGELDKISLTYLAGMWPNLQNFAAMPWAGAGVTIPAAGYILEGDQCLVFFLAGPPVGGAPPQPKLLGGFSINPKDPVYLPPYNAARPQLDRKRYYDFDPGRVVFRANAANPSTAVFPSFQDPYKKQPYAYFSSYKRADGYSPTAVPANSVANWWGATPNSLGLLPYVKTAAAGGQGTVYHNSTTFQIISAGLDGQFGPGGLWPGPTVPRPAMDDMSNFHDRKLGSP
jgi:general secretion pathway protein G